MSFTYESGQIGILWNGIDLSQGLAADSFLTIEPLEDRKSFTFGADGRKVSSKMANKGATITLTLQQTSETNAKIAQIAALEDAIGVPPVISNFSVTDAVGGTALFVAIGAELSTTSAQEYGAAVGEKSWSFVCETYLQSDDPTTLMAALATYVK